MTLAHQVHLGANKAVPCKRCHLVNRVAPYRLCGFGCFYACVVNVMLNQGNGRGQRSPPKKVQERIV